MAEHKSRINAVQDQQVELVDNARVMLLQKGRLPWESMSNAEGPRSAGTGQPYTRDNAIALEMAQHMNGFTSNLFMTEAKGKSIGYEVATNDGEKETGQKLIIFVKNEEDKENKKYVPQNYEVFNVEQFSSQPQIGGITPGKATPDYEKLDTLIEHMGFDVPEEKIPEAYSPIMEKITFDRINSSRDFFRGAEDSEEQQLMRISMTKAFVAQATGIPLSQGKFTQEHMEEWGKRLNTNQSGVTVFYSSVREAGRLSNGITNEMEKLYNQTHKQENELSSLIDKKVVVQPQGREGAEQKPRSYEGKLVEVNEAHNTATLERRVHRGKAYFFKPANELAEGEERGSVTPEIGKKLTVRLKDKKLSENDKNFLTGTVTGIDEQTGVVTMQKQVNLNYNEITPSQNTNTQAVSFISRSEVAQHVGEGVTVHFEENPRNPFVEGKIVGVEDFTVKTGENQGKVLSNSVLVLDTGKEQPEKIFLGPKTVSAITIGTPLKDAKDKANSILEELGEKKGKVMDSLPGYTHTGPFIADTGKVFLQLSEKDGKTNIVLHQKNMLDRSEDGKYQDRGQRTAIQENLKANSGKGTEEQVSLTVKNEKDGRVAKVSQSKAPEQVRDSEQEKTQAQNRSGGQER